MAGKRGRGKPAFGKIVGEEDPSGENPVVVSVLSPSESELALLRLRGRWELASVLNFLHVFQSIIGSKLEISAEEIETALIIPNNTLSQLHISLLKGIPPVSKSLTGSDAWVTAVCKKLAMWWPWVAEGEIPLIAAHGEEISVYKEIDPTIRLLILKALCEVRAVQDDILTYINDTLKDGIQLSTFRKDRIGGDENGTTYWYDGDSVIGHRLYKEVNKVEFKPSLRGKGRLAQPIISCQWETLATNLEEFREISVKLSSSKAVVEAAVGNIVENEIIPVLEQLEKKKERALKRQQKQIMLLNGFLNSYGMENTTRSLRDRRPVSYTFDEYDRSIDEAIQLTKEQTGTEEQKQERKCEESGPEENGTYNEKFRRGGGDDKDDDDYDGKNDDDDESGGDSGNSEKENNRPGYENRVTQNSQKQKVSSAREDIGLRRSKRKAGNNSHFDLETRNYGDTKKQLRHGPMIHTILEPLIISDSEDEKLSENNSNEKLGTEMNVPDGELMVEVEEGNSDA